MTPKFFHILFACLFACVSPVSSQCYLPPPFYTANIEACQNDPVVLEASGGMIKWYDSQKIRTSPQINTSVPGIHTYYVTQSEGICESPMEQGMITVRINSRAEKRHLELFPDYLLLCPNNSVVIEASSRIPYSTFRWYKNSDKTGLFQEGATFTTPALIRDTTYYVTIQYGDLCESDSKPSVISVRDMTPPSITAPPSLVVSTDLGSCEATNVQIGFPVVSDNCTIYGDDNLNLIFTDPPAPVAYQVGNTRIVWCAQDKAGNKSYALQNIKVEAIPGTCSDHITQIIDEDEISSIIYPNPTDGAVTVEFETAGTYLVTITDMAGKVQLHQAYSDKTARIDVSGYPAGVYLITTGDGKRQSTTRIVKQ